MKIFIRTLALAAMGGIVFSMTVLAQGEYWNVCKTSADCPHSNSCCTGRYSDGILKCADFKNYPFSPSANGCVEEAAAADPGSSKEVQNDPIESTTWACYYQEDPTALVKSVKTWEEHEVSDGTEACNKWVPGCVNRDGGCFAIKYSTESESGKVTVVGGSIEGRNVEAPDPGGPADEGKNFQWFAIIVAAFCAYGVKWKFGVKIKDWFEATFDFNHAGSETRTQDEATMGDEADTGEETSLGEKENTGDEASSEEGTMAEELSTGGEGTSMMGEEEANMGEEASFEERSVTWTVKVSFDSI